MQGIFDLVYMIAFLGYIILSLFIIYHIIRYSGNKTVLTFTLIFFIVGTIALLFANATLFFSIPFDQFVPALKLPSVAPKFPL